MRNPHGLRIAIVPLLAVTVAMVMLAGLPERALCQPQQNPEEKATKPNLRVGAYQGVFTTTQEPMVAVSLYNLVRAQVSAYEVDLQQLVPNAAALTVSDPKHAQSVQARLNALDLSKLRLVKRWKVSLDKTYPDEWRDVESKAPLKTPGVYVIQASAKGVETRTWLAITRWAMLVKRSPDKVLAWLVEVETGKPVEGASVALCDLKERIAVEKTARDGLVRFPAPPLDVPCLLATHGGDPAFAVSNGPGREQPYQIYLFTDRPIYRPGHVVRFRGTVRAVERRRYSFPEGLETAHVRLDAPPGSPVYEKDLELNKHGTFVDEFELAPEPPLGSYRLWVTVGEEENKTTAAASFEVEAYRKPEFDVKVQIPQAHYLGGETVPVTISADYYFGSPVSGGKVAYRVDFSAAGARVPERVLSAAGLGISGSTEVEASFDGEAVLDDQGRFVLEVPTRKVPVDRWLRVSATISELALRPQSGDGSTLVTAAKFRLFVVPETYQYLIGDRVVLRVQTKDYDDKPISERVKVTVVETKKDREGRPYEERTTSDIETDSKGEAQVTFKPERPGQYQVEAWAMDDERNPVFAETQFRVIEKAEVKPPFLTLAPDKPAYAPGDVALVHCSTNLVGAWALMTIEGEFLYNAKVVSLGAKDFDLRIPISEAQAPGVTLGLAVVRQGNLTQANAGLDVPPEDKRLKVLLAPDRETYEPGQKAMYSVTVRDAAGRGLPAELGVGVVDTSLFAIRPDLTTSPFDFFHGPGPNRVTFTYSLQAPFARGRGGYGSRRYVGHPVMESPDMLALESPPAASTKAAGMVGPAGPSGEPARVRKQFADTAFWTGSLVTGPDGRTDFSFDMPDNLTTWRASARAMTNDTKAGEEKKDVTTTLPLLVRLALPRFYVQGDEGTAAAIVHNYSGQDRTVKIVLTAEGVEVQGATERTIQLKTDGIERVTWPIKVLGPDKARFLVSANGGEGAKDAMETTLPILADGVENVEALAGVTSDSSEAKLSLPAEAMAGSASLEITLSPSLAGPVFEALEYLAAYPYGCAEQTMDGFLPDIIVARTLKKLGAKRPKPKNLERYVSFGLQKLIRYQHQDGGWHWWEFDESDPYITAYITYGMKIAAEAGYVAAHVPLVRGIAYLRQALAAEEYRKAQAYLLWAMAYADVWDKESLKTALSVALRLYEDRAKLDIFSRASLARALQRLAQQGDLTKQAAVLSGAAATMVGELEGAAKQTGVGVYWPSNMREKWSWLDNDVEVTAQVLSALLEVKPASPHIVPAVRWLMAARRGKSWSSTKDTAAAVLALAKYLEAQPSELAPDFTVRVKLGDRQVQELRMTAEDIFADAKTVKIAAADLKPGENALSIEKTGQGTVYWAARLHYLVPTETAIPIAGDISVKRTFRVPTENPVQGDRQKSGSIIQVELRLRVKENLRYAILEEPIPAGCEVVVGEDEPRRSPWDRREVWDNRIVFFFDYLRRGDHIISYVLRTETPGKYRVLPSAAALMYFPEVRGTNRPAVMRVVEE
ncbi:MAG: alpha-2-macroglobulin [Armatimonadota bacterium]